MAYSELTTYINQILDQKGITGLDSEIREQLVSDLETRLIDQINRAIVEAVPSDKLATFEELTSSAKSDEEVQDFLKSIGVDTQQIATSTMVRFKNLYLGTEK
ncbi:hypothetical protein KBD20_01950 [Candidatus Saccharibacteria bacterium]|nr:hypothetical protein [Candidatus Saccharibacteria bacterium]